MKKSHKVFLFIQGTYSIICILEVILCLIYQSIDKVVYGDVFLRLMMSLILPIASVLIALPTSLIHNILMVISNYKEKSPRRILGLIWTFLSPILYFACFSFAVVLFVTITGGV